MNTPAQEQTKKCSKCGEIKGVGEFAKNKNKGDGLQSRCRKCTADWYAKPENKKRKAERSAEWYAKPENKKRKAEWGAEWYAKPENKKRAAEWDAEWYAKPENKKRVAERGLKRRYGITLEQRDEILKNQGGCCAICKNNKDGLLRWHVDHNHTSGENRAILCSNCNIMIGLSKESIQTHLNAIEYLKEHNIKTTLSE